jgi:hypothetical protein
VDFFVACLSLLLISVLTFAVNCHYGFRPSGLWRLLLPARRTHPLIDFVFGAIGVLFLIGVCSAVGFFWLDKALIGGARLVVALGLVGIAAALVLLTSVFRWWEP